MGRRIEDWKNKGYTEEQIKAHLDFEKYRRGFKIEREKQIKETRKDKIESIKKILKNTQYKFRNVTTDGVGYFITKKFSSNYAPNKKTMSVFTRWEDNILDSIL